MKKLNKWINFIFFTVCIFGLISCPQEPENTVDITAPAEVTNFVITAADGNAVLTWTNPADTDFAGVQVAMSPAEGTLANAVSLGKDVTSLNVSGLEIGSEYTFTVKTFDTSLNYSVGATEKATVVDTADYVAPANVTNLVATNKDASVLLTWEDATDEDVYGYEVTWNKSNPINRSAKMTANSMMVAPGAEGCYISNLTNGTEYTFTVKSVDTSGNVSTGKTVTITPSIIEKSPLAITLTSNTTSKTNQDVVIFVNATTDNASEVKKIAYKEGIFADIDEVFSGTDISTTKEITATENATYTVAATDTAGRRELAFITVSNIDKKAPAQVGNILSIYSRVYNTISLSWTNPSDSDFEGTVITYGKTGAEEVKTIELAKDKTSVVIENIADDDTEYTISIKTKDDVENIGTAKTVTVIAATGAKVTNISLDRTHLDSIMTNREIKVTVSGSNFDLLTSLLVQITDGTNAQPPVTAIINKENNTATATVIAPIPSVPTDEGTTYTVKAILNSTTPSETTVNFVVSKPADVTSIILSERQLKVETLEYVTATITGKNFDIRGVTQVKLFDTSKNEFTTSTVIVPLSANTKDTEFTVKIPVPTVDSVYTVAVFFDNVKVATTSALQVYGVPQITKVSIPTAGVSYGGNSLPVTIEGKNFTAPGISESSFSGTSGITNFKVVSDTKATAEVTCPYVAGETTVTLNCAEASGTAALKVLENDKCFNVGDILFTDGTRIKAENVKYGVPVSQSEKAFAVIASAHYGGGTGKALGLQTNCLKFAPVDTTGYDTVFTELISEKIEISNWVSFIGDLDGSDNWDYICQVDPDGVKNAEINYPAFYFASTYGEKAELKGSEYEEGWYIPSVSELYEVFKNIEILEESVIAINKFIFMHCGYLSSSQNKFDGYGCWEIFFGTEELNLYTTNKNSNLEVRVVKILSCEQFNEYEYATPNITSVTVELAGEGYREDLPVTIIGENLRGYALTCSDSSFSNVNYISDTKVIATITCSGIAGTSDITVTSDKSNAKSTVKVLESSKCYSDADIGKIILEDGSLVTKEEYDSSSMKPIAIVVGTKYKGAQVVGVGLQTSNFKWASKKSVGYETYFEEIITSCDSFDLLQDTPTITGDLDGRDNWDIICKVDSKGTIDAASNYPAFDYANNYGVIQGISGNYVEGWYIPSLMELYEIYKVKDCIEESIKTVDTNIVWYASFWSSSQRKWSVSDMACGLDFGYNVIFNTSKDSDYNVLVVHTFNAQ